MPNASRGVAASLGASALFVVLFLIPPLLEPLEPNAIFAWRVVTTIPFLTALFLLLRQWPDVRAVAGRLRRRPALIVVVVVDGLLLSVQLWLFGWAPQSGHGLDAALGYLLMPLLMVAVGLFLHRERLVPLRLAAVLAALVGVVAAIALAGGISWATVVIAVGYPLYFTIRRHWGLDSVGALWFELVVLLPVVLVILLQPAQLALVAANPSLVWGIIGLGVIGGGALLLYLVASRVLSFGTFGLLSYLEPVLLVVVSVVVLHEVLTPADALVYGPIALALVLLAIESTRRTPPR